jgi:hypothetical protein
MPRLRIPLALCSLLALVSGCGGSGGGGGGGGPPSDLFDSGASVDVDTGTAVTDVALADLDDDGALDLVVVSGASGDVSVAFGGDGVGGDHFGTPVDIAVGGTLSTVTTADVDRDGDIDVIVGDTAGNRIVVLENDGNGVLTLGATIPLGIGADPSDVAILDYDCDGFLDVVVASAGLSSVTVAFGTGGGAFALPITFGLPASFEGSEVVSADFDRDGDLDLAVANTTTGQVQILLSDDLGGVASSTTVALDGNAQISGLVAGDFDGDGDVDVAVTDLTDGDVQILRNNGSGTFLALAEVDVGTGAEGIAAGDFDLDGRTDLVVGVDGDVAVLLGAPGGFDPVVTLDASGGSASDVAVGDLDCDGSLDIVYAIEGTDGVGVLFGRDHDVSVDLDSPADVALALGFDAADVVLVDVNGDGDADLLVADRTTGSLGVALGDGDGTFGSVVTVSGGATVQAEALETADVDADGDVDVVMALGTGDGAAVFLNDGNGTFTLDSTVDTGTDSDPQDVVLADLDADCDLDMAIATGDSISLALGEGDGTFAAPTTLDLGAGFAASALAVGDIDEDGTLDLVAASSATGNVAVLFGLGGGAFEPAVPVPVDAGDELSDLEIGDVDCDGDLDLVVANRTDGTIRVLRNDGTGILGASGAVSAVAGISAISLVDLDRDGDLDVVASSETSGSVSLLINNGSGIYSLFGTAFATGGTGSGAVAVGDLDGDGRIDVVTGNVAADAGASVLLNAGL